MTRMIRHAKSTLNHLRHSGESPQVCGIARCLGSPQQDLLQFLLLLRRQPGWTSRMRFGAQRLQSPFLQILFPSKNRRGRGLDQTADLSNSPPFQEQLGSPYATCFQCLCTSFWSHSVRYCTTEFVPIEKRASISPAARILQTQWGQDDVPRVDPRVVWQPQQLAKRQRERDSSDQAAGCTSPQEHGAGTGEAWRCDPKGSNCVRMALGLLAELRKRIGAEE